MALFMALFMVLFIVWLMIWFYRLLHGLWFVVFDKVLLEHGGLPHVLPLAVHLIFLPEQVEGVILSHFYSLSFFVRGLLHA